MAEDDVLFKAIDGRKWTECTQILIPTATSTQISFTGGGWQDTPLHLACFRQAPLEVIRLLLDKGADVKALNKIHWTPLHCACAGKETSDVIALLLEKGATVNSLTNDDWTPLHLASYWQAPLEVTQLLVSKGADARLENKDGKRPFEYERRAQVRFACRKLIKDVSSSSAKPAAAKAAPAIAAAVAGEADTEALPQFFVDLFAMAKIEDKTIQTKYAESLLAESIDNAQTLALITKDELKALHITLGHAANMVHAAQTMISSSASTTVVPPPQEVPYVPPQVLDEKKLTVMISYQWDSQSTAIQIRDCLLGKEKYNVIMDTTGIHGNFLSWMDWAVRSSHAVIMLITRSYQHSTNCEKEACRAHGLRKKMIPIVLHPDYTGEDWLAMLIAGLLYYDGSSPRALEESLGAITERELNLHLKNA